MDLFKGLLFLDGHVGAIEPGEFAEHFGSAAAAQKMFAERWDSLDASIAPQESPVVCD